MKTRILALLIGIVVGAYTGGALTTHTVYVYEHQQSEAELENYINLLGHENISFSAIYVPAVDADGNGVATTLGVTVVPGRGRTLVNIDDIFFWVDTQNSIRTARDVARRITGIDTSNYDIIYSIRANATVIEGPSAGAALTIATISALSKKPLKNNVMITGTINRDGTIGAVGGVFEKATSAKEIGAETFLVPMGQSVQTTFEKQRSCRQVGISQICTIEQIPVKVNIENEIGIDVEEVRTVEQALNYFFE